MRFYCRQRQNLFLGSGISDALLTNGAFIDDHKRYTASTKCLIWSLYSIFTPTKVTIGVAVARSIDRSHNVIYAFDCTMTFFKRYDIFNPNSSGIAADELMRPRKLAVMKGVTAFANRDIAAPVKRNQSSQSCISEQHANTRGCVMR